MARSVEEILKAQLGNLLLEVAVLSSSVEQLREENAKLKEQQKASEVAAVPAKEKKGA